MNENLLMDSKYRTKAFEWLHNQIILHGDVLPRELLVQGFEYQGSRITFLGPQGIWKPKIFPEIPLSITTVISGPYNDSFSDDGLLLYRYQGTDSNQWDNVGLRKAMQYQVPLVYFNNVVKGRYHAIWPVYIVGDNPSLLTFKVAVDDEKSLKYNEAAGSELKISESASEVARRAYITSTVKIRLHQRSFREKVLLAYKEQCALCRLKHRELLDAAHIIPDSDPEGEPRISNGISLCKLHHAAFDENFIGITPGYIIQVRADILEEKDGPLLKHGLQGLHNGPVSVPREKKLQPDRQLLERKYELFKKAS